MRGDWFDTIWRLLTVCVALWSARSALHMLRLQPQRSAWTPHLWYLFGWSVFLAAAMLQHAFPSIPDPFTTADNTVQTLNLSLSAVIGGWAALMWRLLRREATT